MSFVVSHQTKMESPLTARLRRPGALSLSRTWRARRQEADVKVS